MPAKRTTSKTKPRANGRILTVKQLPKRAYMAIHSLPRGTRGPVMKTLLEKLADYLERGEDEGAHMLLAGRVILRKAA